MYILFVYSILIWVVVAKYKTNKPNIVFKKKKKKEKKNT